MTIPDVHVEGYLLKATPRLVPYWKSWSQIFFDRNGIDTKIDSVQEDGTQSWMVISRGLTKTSRSLPWIAQILFIMTKRLQAQ